MGDSCVKVSVHEQVTRKVACESSADMFSNCVEVSARAFMLFCEVTDRKCLSVKLGDKSDGSLRKPSCIWVLPRTTDAIAEASKNAFLKNHVQEHNRPSHRWICFWTTNHVQGSSLTQPRQGSKWVFFCTASSRGALNEASVSKTQKH